LTAIRIFGCDLIHKATVLPDVLESGSINLLRSDMTHDATQSLYSVGE